MSTDHDLAHDVGGHDLEHAHPGPKTYTIVGVILAIITLIEVWAWGRPEASLCDRSDRPWDDASRRPSHADRRRALQRAMMDEEYQRLDVPQPWSRKIRHLLDGVARLVA